MIPGGSTGKGPIGCWPKFTTHGPTGCVQFTFWVKYFVLGTSVSCHRLTDVDTHYKGGVSNMPVRQIQRDMAAVQPGFVD